MPARTELHHPGVVDDRRIGGICFLLIITLCACQTPGVEQAYPSRPLSFIVPWEAGTGGDVASRILASALEKELDRPVNVVNQAGVNGVIGHTALVQSEADGYTLGTLTEEITMMHWTGLTHIDPTSYSSIALIAVNPPVITVRDDAAWETIHDLITALKANPGTLTASGSRFGGLWDLSRIGFLEAAGLEESVMSWQPSQGPPPALQYLLADSVDVVISSLSAVDSLRRAGQVRTLATMSGERLSSAPDTPTLKESGIDYESVGSWFALAAPKNLPDARLEFLRVAVWNISKRPEFRESITRTGFQSRHITGSALESFLYEEDLRNGLLLDKAGLSLE